MSRLRVGSSGVWIPIAKKTLCSRSSRPYLGRTQPLIQRRPGYFPCGKAAGQRIWPLTNCWSWNSVRLDMCPPPPSHLPSSRGRTRLTCYPFFGGGDLASCRCSVLFHVHFQFNVVYIYKNFRGSYILVMKADEMHYFSYLFNQVLYMFRTGPPFINRSISTLYTRNRYLSF